MRHRITRHEMWFATAVYRWAQLSDATKAVLYALNLRGCPQCKMRRGHKMDCRRTR